VILRLFSPQKAAKKWRKLTAHTVINWLTESKVKKRKELDNFEEICVSNKRKTREVKCFLFDLC